MQFLGEGFTIEGMLNPVEIDEMNLVSQFDLGGLITDKVGDEED